MKDSVYLKPYYKRPSDFLLKKNPDPTTAPLTIIALEKLNKLKKYKDARF